MMETGRPFHPEEIVMVELDRNTTQFPALKGKYKVKKRKGNGAYSEVYKGYDLKTREKVAIKRMVLFHEREGLPKSALREISILQGLNHENVIKLKKVVFKAPTEMYLILEYMAMDLRKYILHKRWDALPDDLCRSYLYQITKGLEYCHDTRVVHRDFKTTNLLIDKNGLIKIADFGLSKQTIVHRMVRSRTQTVTALWYRAPEVLFNVPLYSPLLDIWSLGCVFGEMCSGEVLFRGDGKLDQVCTIFRILTTPNNRTFPGYSALPFTIRLNQLQNPPVYHRNQLARYLGQVMTPVQLDLLQRMLVYDPAGRISARDITEHEYFRGFDPSVRVRPQKFSMPFPWAM